MEQVLKYLISWHPLHVLDTEIISLKLTILLALTDAKRDYEIQKLDIKYMVKTFHIFPEEESLCPYKALNHYLEVTNFWQIKGYRNQLLFSHIETHQPISSPTIARWIKTVLSLAGIEILVLKGHSVGFQQLPQNQNL